MTAIIRHAYSVTLTGAPNSLADLPLKPSSLNMTINVGTSYASVIIQASASAIDDIAARIDGNLVITRAIHYSDGTQGVSAEILNMPFEDFDHTEGARNFSATLKARGTFSNASPITHQADAAEAVGKNSAGEIVFSMGGQSEALAGDSLDHGGSIYPVRQARINITPQGITQEFTEDTTA